MKVIDLLNKIANGEEVPKKIKVNNMFIYEYKNGIDYKTKDGNYLFDSYVTITKEDMNMEIEIIEDTSEENKKIEKLDLIFEDKFIKERFKSGSISYLDTYTTLEMLYEKQCEIIDKINKGEENE